MANTKDKKFHQGINEKYDHSERRREREREREENTEIEERSTCKETHIKLTE